ncbi:carboxypeptidase-like regulatory domain-containing protein [Flagellimonas onchidii]|uniref:carboxypeptidase-like regulatory domain-containing protein n=1 Tax=Flagellimonas onchidii TaxID=2562684 RepID=UPI0010A6A488|nr:carboxypeptidase-like regulatory domain-containing protein [Allomuricauda onchidii]
MSKILTIPKPCSEDWNKMTPTQKGAYCKSCQKEVVDFTTMSKTILAQKLSKGNNLCGRFKANQLNTPLPSIARSRFQRNMALLGYTSLLAIGSPLAAQEVPFQQTYQVEEAIIFGVVIPELSSNDPITIKGNVGDSYNPLPGATVSIKGTQIKTQTDFDGNFLISLPRQFPDKNATLIISSLGYMTIEKVISIETGFVQVACTELEEDIMGELVIVRKQNIFRRFLNLFRKK